ncbi:hypothetical protein BHM03_00011335 [Ensete ventricosum]|nr:hypothetical protein BHM03_00011335 [Ensete ventricosum]
MELAEQLRLQARVIGDMALHFLLPNDKWNVFVGPDRGPPAVPENPRLRGEDHGWHEEGDLLRPWVRQTDRGRRSAMTDVAAEGRCRIRTVFASEVGSS